MNPFHSLLRRQLKRHFGEPFSIPEEWVEFVNAVSAAYREFDVDREMLERSLELSSLELLEANSEMRAIFQTLPDLLFRIDGQGTILDFKAGATSDVLLGRRHFFGKRIQDIPVRHVGEMFEETIHRVLAENKMASIEYSLNPNGHQAFYEARLVPLPENQMVVIVRNITERKRLENLRDGQSRILEMITRGAQLKDILTDLVHTIESQTTGMLCSVLLFDESSRQLRHGAAPGLPEVYNHLMDGLEIGPCAGSCGTAAFRKEPVIVSDIATDPLWAECRDRANQFQLGACWSMPILSQTGEVLGTFAMYYREPRTPRAEETRLIEVAARIAGIAIARRRAEDELGRAMSLLQSTLDSTAEGILVVDGMGRIVLHNKRFAALWGIPKDVLDKHDDEAALAVVLNQLKDPDEFLRKVRALYSAPEEYSSDLIEFKDGRAFERYSCPQRLDGAPVGRVWTFHDITQRRHLEEQLRQSQKMEAFGQLAAGIAHDFNNILTIIQGNLSLLQMGLNSKDDEAAAIEQGLTASERAANLTRQLLTFGRRQPMRLQPLDLNDVIANLTKMLQRIIGEHIMLEARYAPGGAPVLADVNMMEQVFINLAVNSRDAMPNGGKLIVEIQSRSARKPASGVSEPDATEFIQLRVVDTGSGIKPEHLPHIFEPFFTTKDVGKGTGLGLATVFAIVQQHHGRIQIETKIGEGTVFQIFLPRLSNPVLTLPENSSAVRLHRGKESVLLVEDEPPVRDLMRRLLTRAGYKIHTASSGQEALTIWNELRDHVDLLITDLVMPNGVTGRELADRLRAEKPSLKVIYCSGYSHEMPGENSPLRNNSNFLEKPFEPQKLFQCVRDCLDS